MPQVIAGNVLAEGLLSDYAQAYMNTRREQDSKVSMIMDVGARSFGRTDTRAYFEAAPHMRHQPMGDPIPEEGMDSKNFQTVNYPYGLRIPWHMDDREDDRTGSLKQAAEAGGKSAALSAERGLFDLLNGTTSFIPAVPNASDGTAIFSTSTRFEVSTGNSLTGFSVSSGPAFRAGVQAAIAQFGLFKDGKGQPLFTDAELNSPVLVICARADMFQAAEAFHIGTVAQNAPTAANNAAGDNILRTVTGNIVMWATSRVSSGTAFVHLTGTSVKPFLMQERTKIQTAYATVENDPEARNTGREYTQWRQRLGFGVGIVPSVIKLAA